MTQLYRKPSSLVPRCARAVLCWSGSGPLGRAAQGEAMVYHGIQVSENAIADFCRRNHIQRLALYGSILTNDFGPDSDVDMLFEFQPDKTPGLAFFSIQRELGRLLGREVDLNTPEDLSRYFREGVLAQARPLYG